MPNRITTLAARALEALSNRMICETPIPAGAMQFFAPTPLLQHRAATALTKEPGLLRWMDDLGADAVLWDIGANVGTFSLYAALRNGCTVIAFEPSAANFFVLARNIQLNRLDERITAYCLAFGGTTESGSLNLSSQALGTALNHFGRAGEMSRYSEGEPGVASHGMLAFTIDDFTAWFKPPFPTHLKIDVDGLEFQILKGAAKTLADPRLRVLMVELTVSDLEENSQAVALLESYGLSLVAESDHQHVGSQSAANFLFKRHA